MKRLLLTGVMILLVSSLFGPAQAQMYWDSSTEPDATIKDSDFSKPAANQRPAKSLGDKEIYDDYQVLEIDPEEAEAAAAVVAPTPAPEPRAITPRRQDTTTRSTTDTLSRPRTTIRRSTERATGPRSTTSQPKPAETSPGEPSTTGQAGTAVTPGKTTPPEDADRPSTKRMKWGQEAEEKTAEPKAKLQWGR